MHAKDVMTGSVVCINVGDSIFDAAELLLGARVSAVPVVDDKNAVVGIVSEADLIRRAEIGTTARKGWLARLLESDVSAANDFATAHTRRVADVMTKEVVTAGPDATLRELVELMERHGAAPSRHRGRREARLELTMADPRLRQRRHRRSLGLRRR